MSKAELVNGSFYAYPGTVYFVYNVTISSTPHNVSTLWPAAKIGNGNYIYVFNESGSNYFGLTAITGLSSANAHLLSTPGLTSLQAYNIDLKTDDGFPQSGNVRARFLAGYGSTPLWVGVPDTAATPTSATTCYDNGNVSSARQQYSVSYNGGNGQNCALSFKLQ